MEQILLHFWGDYVFQNDWMARNKINKDFKSWIACLIHCILYSLPFLLITDSKAVIIIFISHFFIDKFRLARYIIMLKNFTFNKTGFPEETPEYLSTGILLVIDNLLHITINYLSITYL